MQEDEDPVVQEIPVYLSKLLAEKLFLYQYPVRPRDVSYDDSEILQSQIKPQHQEVRLELALDTRSTNFDTSKAEMIAWNVDGTGKKEEKKTDDKFFKNDLMDTQVLESTRAVPDTSSYAVAIYHDKELHITPLRGIVHLRPSFGYLDMSDKRAKQEAKEQGEGEMSGEEEEEAKQVTVKFARQENERVKRARERSFGYLSKKSAEEPWYHTQFHKPSSELAELERGKLYCTRVEEKVDELSLTVDEYMKSLIPVCEEVDDTEDTSLLSRVRSLSLVDQVRNLLKGSKVIHFSQLVALLDQSSDVAGLLRTVQQVAVLVQGNWVVRSEILYPKDTSSYVSGVPAELMCRSRDYILYLFTQSHFVDRQKVSSVVKLPAEEVHEILEQVATLRPHRGWELKLPLDKDFISRYPEVSQRQQMWWDAKQKQLSEAFSGCKTRRKSNRDSSVSDNELSTDGRPSPKRSHRRKSNHRESLSSDNESGTEGSMKQPQTNCAKVARRTNKQSVAMET